MDAHALQDSLDSSKRQLSPRCAHLATHYTLLEQIGKGSYGIVWLARKRIMAGRDDAPLFAVKQVRKRHAGPKRMLEIMGEVETMSLLSHVNIVKLEETFQDESNLWIVMEYMDGGELQRRFSAHSPPPEALTRSIITQLVLAVEYIHDKGIVHRDLKPANCLLTKDGQTVKISDFGFAVLAGVEQCLTTYCGTIAFMAPEILLERNYGKPVDMWSIGVMTYLLSVGELPFSGSTAANLTRAICSQRSSIDHPRLREHALLHDFVSRLLTHDPNRRMTARDALRHPWLSCMDHPSSIAVLSWRRQVNSTPLSSSSSSASLGTVAARGAAKAGGTATAQGMRRTPLSHCATDDKATTSAPLRRLRSSVIAVMAAHRMRYLQRCQRLVKLGYGEFALLRDFRFLTSGAYTPRSGNALLCSRMFHAKPHAILEVLPMIESCAAMEHVDLSANNISSLGLVQSILRVVGKHPSITSLDLSHNPIPSVAARGLMRLARNPVSRLLHIAVVDTGVGADVLAQMEVLLKEKANATQLVAGHLAGNDASSTENDVASSQHASTSSSLLARCTPQRTHVLLGVSADAKVVRERRAQHKQLYYTKLPPIPHAALLRRH